MFESFRIDKYFSDGKIIGSGSFANVCKGYNMETKKDVAIKIIKPVFANKSKKHKKQLEREILIIRQMNHHNIVKCFGVFEHPDSSALCIVMEYCDGGTLDDYLKTKGGRLNEYVVQNIMKQLADGLSYLRKLNIFHRDLKPENLLIKYEQISKRKKFVLKISDFGLATMVTSDYAMAQTRCGSRLYMAPEIYLGQDYTYKADLWSVGAILHLLIYGEQLFTKLPHPDMFRPTEKLFDIKKFVKFSDISDQCKDLLSSLLKNNPKERINWMDFISHDFFKSSLCKKLSSLQSSQIDISSETESKLIENLLDSVINTTGVHLNQSEINKLKVFSLNNSLLINDATSDIITSSNFIIKRKCVINLLKSPIIQNDKLASNLIHNQNKILTILCLGDKKQKNEMYIDAYVLYKHGVLSIKQLLIKTENIVSNKKELKTDLVRQCLKDIYNVFTKYINETNLLKNKLSNRQRPLLYIVISHIRYIDRKVDLDIMFNKFEKSQNKLRFGLSCLDYLQSFVIKKPITKSCIMKYNPPYKRFVDTELLEILQNDKLTIVLIHHYIALFIDKLQKISS